MIKGRSVVLASIAVMSAMSALAQVALNIQSGVSSQWSTATNRTYQLQYSGDGGATWLNSGSVMNGDGLPKTNLDFSNGTKIYRVLEMTAAIPAASAIPSNGSFENGSGGSANGWNVDTAAGGPVYAVRTNANPHTGSYEFQVKLASTGSGPVVQFNQSAIPVTGGTSYPFTFFANAKSGSSGANSQWRIQWSPSGDTGYQSFTPGNGTYSAISNYVSAPAGATSAIVYFHFAGAASSSQSAIIDLDDAQLGSGGTGAGTPASTNLINVTNSAMINVSWASTSGTLYQPQSSTSLSQPWNTNYAIVTGDGSTKSMMFPKGSGSFYFRLSTPIIPLVAPQNLQQLVSGISNAIALAWTASPSPQVTGYRVIYGVSAGNLNQSIDVGNVSSSVIPNLTQGQTYYLKVIAVAGDGRTIISAQTLSAQPDQGLGVVPLYDASTLLEPDTLINTSNALITRIADRPRARHARESEFKLYDTYLEFYWEQRMTDIEIIDTVAKGGSSVTFNIHTLNALDQPNIRFFFQGQTTVAQYSDNEYAQQVDSSLTNWTFTVTHNNTFGRAIKAGDRMEFEFSPFMLTVTNGQLNYYGGAVLYVIGQGIVPWQEGATDDPGSVNAALDSVPIPTNGWLAGANTMPYQYSAESNHVFNQMSPFTSALSGEPFLLGRRLHHTDFGDGAHAEQPNPVFTEQIGKLGPKFINRSCVACHANNSRALPPATGAAMLQSVVHVGSDASGTADALLGSVLQPQVTNGTPEDTVSISGFTTMNGQYGDGTAYTLQKPTYTFGAVQPAYYSVRLAPQLVGMGLLEAISEADILAAADPDDSNHDGIAGRAQIVTDPLTGQPRLGRFGYKAGKFRVSEQIASALNTDMGVTTSWFRKLDGQTNVLPVELSDSDLTNWTRYLTSLGVNARRNLTDSQSLHGEQLFASANCAKCHTTTFVTSSFAPIAEMRNQTIHPYTDLLLHDMGTGLADNMGEGQATGAQWRTSPLWSIGLTPGTTGGEAYLHDGRARTLEEAILWHGGEGEASKEVFRNMSASDRTALIAFLKSL